MGLRVCRVWDCSDPWCFCALLQLFLHSNVCAASIPLRMLRVWSVSGDELAAFPAGDVSDVEALKHRMRKLCGIPVSIQAILHNHQRLEISQKLDVPMELQLVQESFHATAPVRDRRRLDLELIQYAATTGNDEVARRLLDAGADKDCIGSWQDGETVLIRSAAAGHVGMVQLLLERSASVDLSRSDGKTALICSCQNQYVEVSRLLLQARASSHKCDLEGMRPVHHAARQGCVETLTLLLQSDPCADLPSGREGNTPLIAACREAAHVPLQNRASLDMTALHHGADVNFHRSNDSTPLLDACRDGRVKAARLLQAGAYTDCCDSFGMTALHHAAQGGHPEMITALLKHGADVNFQSTRDDSTPLLFACRAGHAEAARILLQAGAYPDCCDSSGMTALDHATQEGHLEMITVLLKHGADKDFQSQSNGSTPLLTACRRGRVEAARLLLQAGASLDMTSLHQAAEERPLEMMSVLKKLGSDKFHRSKGSTPLLDACRNGRVKAARLLLQAGAYPDCCDSSGMTALHHAAQEGHLEMMTVLLKHGADKDFQSQKSGRTALLYALTEGHVEAARLLLQADANPGLCDVHGMMALDHAAQGGRSEIFHVEAARLLLQARANPDLRDAFGMPALCRAALAGEVGSVG